MKKTRKQKVVEQKKPADKTGTVGALVSTKGKDRETIRREIRAALEKLRS